MTRITKPDPTARVFPPAPRPKNGEIRTLQVVEDAHDIYTEKLSIARGLLTTAGKEVEKFTNKPKKKSKPGEKGKAAGAKAESYEERVARQAKLEGAEEDHAKCTKEVKKLERYMTSLDEELEEAIARYTIEEAAKRATSTRPKQVAGNKRKATDEANQAPTRSSKRLKAGPAKAATSQSQDAKPVGPSALACAPSQSAPARKTTPTSTKRMVSPGPRKAQQAGSDALRPQTSGVTKRETPAKGRYQLSESKLSKAAALATGATDSSQRPKEDSRQGQKPSSKSVKPSGLRTGPSDQEPGPKLSGEPSTSSKATKTAATGTGSNSKISGASKPARSLTAGTAASTARKGVRDGASKRTIGQSTTDNTEVKSNSQPKGKKRSAPDDTDSSSGNESKRQKLTRGTELKGLTNHYNACFSNAVIQFLYAALEGHDIDALLGKLDEVETFDLTAEDISKFDTTAFAGELPASLKKKQYALRSAIKAAAKAGETEKLSAVKHLRSLLEDLRADYQGLRSKQVSPFVFQSVVAWGAAEDADRSESNTSSRQRMSGDSQEDVFEYYQMVLNDLTDDPRAADPDALRNVFEIEAETICVCPDSDCDHEYTPRKVAPTNYHNVDLSSRKADESQSLEDLLEDSLTTYTETWCKSKTCNGGYVREKTTFTEVPDSLVVRINRTSYDKNKASKFNDVIDLNPALKLHGRDYGLAAVIVHKGTINRGHYTIYRKQQERWYCLDDKQRIAESPEDMSQIAKKRGQPVMVLYKKVKA